MTDDPTSTSSTPSGPGDQSALSVLATFADGGWSIDHLVRPGGEIECGRCGESTLADRWRGEAEHRIEGASDPDDLQLAAGISCPRCEAQGAIVLGYGPMASDDDADVMLALDLDDAIDPVASS
ncbi:MAG: hypothetical protein ABJH68_21030 [Ilumatobacter sp.]|uniref:hypothetical protein n=1 Tax=Ilumatobacter sp. TaxID=1967498 RepID=UPI0032975F79